jgi:hypothetical protein
LNEVMQKINKKAFVASPQTQQAVADAQQQGVIAQPPPPAPGSEGQPQIGFNEIAQLLQEGLGQLAQLQQQTAQMVQQIGMELQVMKMGGKGEKKKSVQERLDQMEQMMAQLTGGAAPQQDQAAAAQSEEQQYAQSDQQGAEQQQQ